ncbi:MAG: hypothetical protein OXL96_28180, partial [Candidatus Poribacteria bacterium]|nr:hypothetical protein [Candidatus Poribacteria bacterium]
MKYPSGVSVRVGQQITAGVTGSVTHGDLTVTVLSDALDAGEFGYVQVIAERSGEKPISRLIRVIRFEAMIEQIVEAATPGDPVHQPWVSATPGDPTRQGWISATPGPDIEQVWISATPGPDIE